MLTPNLETLVLQSTLANAIASTEVIQTLWSGYGEILRINLEGAAISSVIIKTVSIPENSFHPRGWNTELSQQRKIKSYNVEMHWYGDLSRLCDESCRVARCYATSDYGNGCVIVLEDLDVSGFPLRYDTLDLSGAKSCLRWLAHFHARFMNVEPVGLWQTGTYWHLQTRPDELHAMADGDLKNAAVEIDRLLNNCQFKTLVHGDAKVANFCFSPENQAVAAVDFQYIGAGCGMKDVAYFLGSCLDEHQCDSLEKVLLDYYFSELHHAITQSEIDIHWEALEAEWREMFPVAWTDFHRFVAGWMPTHHKIHSYTRKLTDHVLNNSNYCFAKR